MVRKKNQKLTKRQAPMRKAPKRQAPKRQTPKHQTPKRQTPKRQAPKRKKTQLYPIIPAKEKFATKYQRQLAYEKELKKGLSNNEILKKLRKQGLKIRRQIFLDEIRPLRRNIVEYNNRIYTDSSIISASQYEPRKREAQKKRYHAIFEIETYKPDESGRPIKNTTESSYIQIGSNRLRSIDEWRKIILDRLENFEQDYTRKIKRIRIAKLIKYTSRVRTRKKKQRQRQKISRTNVKRQSAKRQSTKHQNAKRPRIVHSNRSNRSKRSKHSQTPKKTNQRKKQSNPYLKKSQKTIKRSSKR